MPEQKKKLSMLCLTGFLLVILSPILYILISTVFEEFLNFTVIVVLFVIAVLMVLAGLVLSIAGLATSRKGNKKGKGFGIAGIILTGVYAVVVLIISLIAALIGSAIFAIFSRHETDKTISTFYTKSDIVAVRYYYYNSDGYRFEELDEDLLDDFIDDLDSMEIEYGGAMDYYWGGKYGIEMELKDGKYLLYDGTNLTYSESGIDDEFPYNDKIKDEFVYVTDCDFWEVMEEYFPSIEENGDHVYAS